MKLLIHHPGDFRAAFSLPLNGSIAPYSSPRQSLSRGPWFLKSKEKAKTWIPTPSSPRQFLSRGPWFLKVFGFTPKFQA